MISRSRVVTTPRRMKEIKEIVRPMTDDEINEHGYPSRARSERKPAAEVQGPDEEDK